MALLPGTNFEGQSVEMKEPKKGNRIINAGKRRLTEDGEFYDWTITELSNRSLSVYHLDRSGGGTDLMFAFSSSVCYTINIFDHGNTRI